MFDVTPNSSQDNNSRTAKETGRPDKALWLVAAFVPIAWFLATFAGIRNLTPYTAYHWGQSASLILCAIFGGLVLLSRPAKGKFLTIAALAIVAGTVVLLPLLSSSAASLLGLLWFLGLSAAIGSLLLSRMLEHESVLERLMLATPVGFGCLSLVMLFLGLFIGYSRLIIVGTLAAITVAVFASRTIRSGAFLRGWKWPDSGPRADFRFTALAVGLSAVSLLQAYVWTQAPPIHADSVAYHLAVPQLYLSEKRLVEIPDTRGSYWSHNAEMLYTAALAIGGYKLPPMIHWGFGVIGALAVYHLGDLVGGRLAGPLAALLFISLPISAWEAGSAYVDLITTTFVTCAAYCLLRWWNARSHDWLILSGLLAGFGMGTKLNAFYFVAPAGLLICIESWRVSRRWQNSLSNAGRFTVPLVAVSITWFALSAAWTGNPFYPYLQSLFHSDKWVDLPEPRYHAVAGILGFLRVPFDLSFNPGPFYMGEYFTDFLGGILLLGFPVFLCAANKDTRKLTTVIVVISSIAVVMWYIWGSYGRMLLPCVPLIAVLAALNVEAAWRLVRGRAASLIVGTIGILALGAWFVTVVLQVLPFYFCEERIPYRVAMGLEKDEEFLKRTFTGLPVAKYLNRLGGNFPVKVLAMGTGIRFYAGKTRMYDNATSHLGVLSGSMSPPELGKALSAQQFNYVLVNHRAFPRGQSGPATPGPAKPPFLDNYCRLLFEEEGIGVYRFYDKPFEPRPTFLDHTGVAIKTLKKDDVLSYNVESGKGMILRTPIDAGPGMWQIAVKGQIQVNSGRLHYGIVDTRGNVPWSFTIEPTGAWRELPDAKPVIFGRDQYFLYFHIPAVEPTQFSLKGLAISYVTPVDDPL